MKKRDKTIMIENDNIKDPVKKVRKHSGSAERIKTILEDKPKKRKHPIPARVIPLEYPFFIKIYSGGFALCEAKKPTKDGEPYYAPLLYTSRLNQMFEIAVNHMIKLPMDVQELSKKLDHIYDMIDARVENKKASELFEEYKNTQEFLEDFK